MTALNPVRSIGDQLLEAVRAHAALSRAEARERAISLLERVGIPAPARRMRDYPFQFSGGPLRSIGGSPPSLIDVPEGCRFAPRCRHVVAKCRSWDTELLQTGQRQQAARCWRQEEIAHEIGRSQA